MHFLVIVMTRGMINSLIHPSQSIISPFTLSWIMANISRRSTRRLRETSDTMPLLDHCFNMQPSPKTKAAHSPEPPLKRSQTTLRLRLQPRGLRPETWWKSLTAFGPLNEGLEQKLQHERAVAQEEVRQEWMQRLRPKPYRQCSPAKRGKGYRRG